MDRLKMTWMTVHCQQKSECFNQRVVIPDQLVKLLCVMTALVAEGRAVDVLYLYYSKAFDPAPPYNSCRCTVNTWAGRVHSGK